MQIKLGLIGANGKMGKEVLSATLKDPRFTPFWEITSQSDRSTPKADVIIDFSTKEALEGNLLLAINSKTPIVIGTTGLSSLAPLENAARQIPVFFAPNFSLGVAVCVYLTKKLAQLLPKFSPSIQETHHIHKKDAPSGTAIALKKALLEGRPEMDCPIESIREGNVVGKHCVTFKGDQESITLSHEAFSREAFAKGSLEAAFFLSNKKPGLYSMQDLLEGIYSK